MIIKIANKLDLKPLANTYLSLDTLAGTSTFGVRNISGFAANWAIQLNNTGQDKAEILMLSSASGTTFNVSGTLKFDHPSDTPVFGIKFDQVVFKKSISGTAGTAVTITNGTVSITADNKFTQFDDTSAASGYAYKACFRNSVTLEVSSDSDWLTTDGFSFFSKAKMKDRVKTKLFSTKYLIKDDSIIDTWVNEWLEEMTNAAVAVNKDYLLKTVDVFHGTAGLGTITATDYVDVRSVWFTTDGSNYSKAAKLDVNNIDPRDSYSSIHPYYYFLGDNIIGKKPDSVMGTARLVYYSRPQPLYNDTDELPYSMKSYSNSFVDYACAQAYYLDGKDTMGDRYMERATGAKTSFRLEISPRSKTGIQMMDLDEATSGNSNIDYPFNGWL